MNWNQLSEAVDYIKSKVDFKPTIGIVLGTGLGNLINEVDVAHQIAYDDIPNFPLSTVEFHTGKLLFGTLGGKKIVAMQGRMHFYEGYDMTDVVFPIQVLKLLGIEKLFLSNASGAINLGFKKGELMLIEDHVNLFPAHPLVGLNDDRLGVRFPDMQYAYDPELNAKVTKAAAEMKLNLRKGIYITAQGPMLETPAEYRMLRHLGGDAVGMSTVPEVIAANHMELPCCAISVLTDECAPDHLKPIDIEEIIAVAGKAEQKLTKLFVKVMENL